MRPQTTAPHYPQGYCLNVNPLGRGGFYIRPKTNASRRPRGFFPCLSPRERCRGTRRRGLLLRTYLPTPRTLFRFFLEKRRNQKRLQGFRRQPTSACGSSWSIAWLPMSIHPRGSLRLFAASYVSRNADGGTPSLPSRTNAIGHR